MNDKKLRVGVVGCGTISQVYFPNICEHYTNMELVACADLIPERVLHAQTTYNIPRVCTAEEMVQMDDIDLIINLTTPDVHYYINKLAVTSGKHVYCEKPLAIEFQDAKEVVELAKANGVRAVAAPDTFMGAGIQTTKDILDQGLIGRPVGFTANVTSCGPEIWHPNPGFYFQYGASTMFDMGPYFLTALINLIGPIKRISCFASIGRETRNILGEWKAPEVPTHYSAILEFACGATGTMMASHEVWDSNLPKLEIFGTTGSISSTDPNMFNGTVRYYDGQKLTDLVTSVKEPHPVPLITMVQNMKNFSVEYPSTFATDPSPRLNMRGLGLSDLAESIMTGRESLLREDVCLHVVEALNGFHTSAETGVAYEMTTTCERAIPMCKEWGLWEVK